MANTYTLISSNTLGSDSASVTFNSIPSTYTDLNIRISARTNRSSGVPSGDQIIVRYNSDSATNYSLVSLRGNGVSGTSSEAGGGNDSSSFYYVAASGNTTNTFTSGEIYIPNYTSTASKQVMFNAFDETNGTSVYMVQSAQLYRGTSAISSIVFTPKFGTAILAGSSFYLYGIKNSQEKQ